MKALVSVSTPGAETRQQEISSFPADVGRGPDCAVRVESPSVSDRHCSILNVAGCLFVIDKSSTNGTFLNGNRLAPGRLARISGDDVLSVGPARLRITAEKDVFSGGTRTIFRRMLDAAEIGGDAGTGPALIILNGSAAGAFAALPAEEGASIAAGRAAGVALKIPDRMASSRHFEVTRRAGAFHIGDAKSRNGTFVNGVRLSGDRVVANGDEITAGDTVLLVVGVEPPDAKSEVPVTAGIKRSMERLVIPAASILGLVSIVLAAVFVAYALG
ncbi:MAG: FHA domain-containing protein [Deltaproteobacteria bacterium]|nr:FHA domain-containing protein [Deltaproteobacteria bacterium]